MKVSFRSVLHQYLRYFGLDIIKWHKVPENTLLGLTEYDIRTVLDIGANTGQSASEFRRVFPDAFIYCFEPLIDPYMILDEWAQTQNGKVAAINLALGNQDGAEYMKAHVDFTPSSSFLTSTRHSTGLFPQISRQAEVKVQIARLDNIVGNLKITPPTLIKMDVQGFESQVIAGGRTTISQAVACILEVSLQPLYEGQPSFSEIHNALQELGFEYAGNLLQIYDQTGSVIYIDALFRKLRERG